jgi:sec-independent protein translocase protein TatA
MPNLGPTELIIIGVVLVLLFGATRLPMAAKGIGQALNIFKKEIRSEDKQPAAEVPPAQTTTDQAGPAPAAAQAAPVSQANGAAPAQTAKDSESAK